MEKVGIEEKKRSKMYKAGKQWIVAPIIFLGIICTIGLSTDSAHAAETKMRPTNGTTQTADDTPAKSSQQPMAEATQQISAASQPATAEAAQSTDNTGTIQKDTTSVQQQTVVSTNQESVPIGQPTETAQAEEVANKETTITKEFTTPDVDQAVAAAKKSPNITVKETPKKDLGKVDSTDLAAKEKEVAVLQKNQAEAIEKKITDVENQNAEIDKANQKIAAQNKAEKERYAKEVEEYNKHKTENGYLKEAISKNLVFDRSVVTKETKITSITGGKFIKAADFNKISKGQTSDIYSKLRKDLGKKATGSFSTAYVKATEFGSKGGYAVLLEKGKPVTVTYTGLAADYLNRKITKAEFIYEAQSAPSKSGTLNAVFSNDPIITVFVGTENANGKDVKVRLTIKLFDDTGKEVLPTADAPFVYSFSSLNSSLGAKTEADHAEFVTDLGTKNQFKKINGSYIDKQSDGKIYSKQDIDYGTGKDHVKHDDWDFENLPTAYKGSGVGVVTAGGRISFSFGATTQGKVNFSGSQWFAFSTNVNAKSITPIFKHDDPKKPVTATIEYNGYQAEVVPAIIPNKEVTDGVKNINNLNVKRGDSLQYIVTGNTTELAKVDPKTVTEEGIRDKFDASKVTIDPSKVTVYQADGALNEKDLGAVTEAINLGAAKDVTDSYQISLDEDVVTAMMHKGSDGSVVLPMGYKYLLVLPFVVKNIEGDFENQATQITNDGENVTNTVINHVSGDNQDPLKDVKSDKNGTIGTVSINDKDIALNTKIYYEINSSERPANYGGITEEWSMNDVLDVVHDSFTGNWKAITNYDIKVGDQILKAGSDISSYITLDNKGGKDLTFTMNKEFLDLLNEGANKVGKQSWNAYIEVNRIKDGDIENTQTENYNKEYVRSNTVITHTPIEPKPAKMVQNVNGEDINYGNVARGDVLSYQMTWDLTGYDKDFAFDSVDITTGVSFFDDFDQTKISPIKDLLQVKDSKGINITKEFTITWNDEAGSVNISAKDPVAFIETFGGQELKVSLPTKIKANVDGDVRNVALQNTFGKEIETNPVVNHIPKVNPTKDVVINIGDKDSRNGATIKIGEKFFYEFTSNDIPAEYAGVVSEWSIKDKLDLTHDEFTGQWSTIANSDVELTDGTIITKGTDISDLFEMKYEASTGILSIKANKTFLDAMNLEVNKTHPQSWKAFFNVKRIAAGDVENTIEESFNNEVVKTNTVVTHTPELPKTPEKTVTPKTQISIPEVKPVPKKVLSASVVPQLPKTGEDKSKGALLSVVGGVLLAMVGFAGASFKRKSNKQ